MVIIKHVGQNFLTNHCWQNKEKESQNEDH